MKRKRLEEYIGETYNHLTITGIDRERRKREGSCNTYVFADCDCGVCNKSYNLAKIKKGETKSCGHLKKAHEHPTKTNEIIHKDNYGIIMANNNEFYFDLEDEKYLLNKYWYEDSHGYLIHCYVENGKNHYVKFHRLIMNALPNEYIDHINQQKNDNRKINLRKCSHKENDRNKGLCITNKSGITGVCWDKSRDKWSSQITVDTKTIHLGRYDEINDAIKSRLKAEIQYFKEYAPQLNLIDLYFTKEESDEIRKNASFQF